ncbi:MAG: 1-acyl-sn-glycerol-3-phosphate acyltransferase [Deltaproteobacteria bacterium]|nr:1-acyl-sn-glycerol-3-phosphate acyltransferase [Deltaproteobacteria bacterium]
MSFSIIARTLLLWTIGVPLLIVFSTATATAAVFDKSGNAPHTVASMWMKLILFLSGVGVEVSGAEKLPPPPFILAANHTGTFDIPVVQGRLPAQFRWIAKKSLFGIPFLGWAMYRAGYVPVDLDNSRESVKSLIAAAEKIAAGTSVLIFPEGTRNTTGKLAPFKRGAFILAQKSGAPIVPVSISGTRDIMKIGGFVVRPHKVNVSIGSPIESKGKKAEELSEQTFTAVDKGIDWSF